MSCGKLPFGGIEHKDGRHPNSTTDPVFLEYIEEFKKEFFSYTNVPVIFKDNTINAIAVCTKWRSGYREVSIVREYWNKLNHLQKEQLIFHELGHCVLDLDHNSSHIFLDFGYCPASIMRNWAFNKSEIENCYKNNRDY